MIQKILKRVGAVALAALVTVGVVGCGSADVNMVDGSIPRAEASQTLNTAFDNYLAAVQAAGQDLHSIMIVKDGKVVKEQWMSEGDAATPHILNSVSKTFTATAVGFAIAEGKLSLSDKVVDIFPDKLPSEVSDNLKKVEVRHLLTMSAGHDTEPSFRSMPEGADWVEAFLAHPFVHEPGTFFWYNNMGTYMLSAIVQKVTGEKVVDYLKPRLFDPLCIEGATWQESPQGINTGGWGLYLKTEDLAKVGQLILQGGVWNGEQLISSEWIAEATAKHIDCRPAGWRPEQINFKAEDSDWLQGYCYQMWRCRHGAVRADGASGQYIIVMPEQNAVIAMTANIPDMQGEINLVWEHLLPALQ